MKILKFILKYLFTVDKKNKNTKPLSVKNHFKYRLILTIIFSIFLYIFLFSYVREDFTLINVIKTFLFLIFLRFLAKDYSDCMIVIFFYKSSYKVKPLTLRQKRLKKLKKLND